MNTNISGNTNKINLW